MFMPIREQAKREQLMRDGFCVFENVLDADTLANLNAMSEWTIAQEEPEHFERHRAQGCEHSAPAYDELPEEVQALIAGHVTDHPDWHEWVKRNRSVIGALMPAYAGTAEPATWSNTAGAGLK